MDRRHVHVSTKRLGNCEEDDEEKLRVEDTEQEQ